MSDMLTKLIERLEKASGPDRELDEAIACFAATPHPKHGKPVAVIDPPRYTASIDAALMLVPYNREWHTGSVTLLGTFWAEVITPTERHTAKGAKTSAIALCITALKSRSTPEATQ